MICVTNNTSLNIERNFVDNISLASDEDVDKFINIDDAKAYINGRFSYIKKINAMKMTVINEKGMPETHPVYTVDKFSNVDPYDVFTAGAQSYITIENPNSKSNKHLILFRDSFGSSLIPLLAEGYKSIVLVDIRYIQSDFLSNFVDFTGKDVLFLYSSVVLNNSETFK